MNIPLKYVAHISAGQSPPSAQVSDLTNGLAFLQGNAEFKALHPAPRLECDTAPKKALKGDILVSVRAPVGALNIADRPYGIGRGLCAIRAQRCDERFLWWWMHAQRHQLDAVSTGTTYRAVTAEDLEHLSFPALSMASQRRIARFLDTETARIDHVAELRRMQRNLLTSRRWSHFQEILDAAAGPVIPLRRVVRSIIDGPFGSAFSSTDYVDEGAAVVRLGNIGFSEYRSIDQARIPMSLYQQFQYHQVLSGDVLIAGLGDARNHAGRACVAPDLGPAIVKGKCFRARMEPETADAEFIALLLSSPVGASAIEGRGSTRSMINLEIVKAALLPIPELRAQRSVVTEHRKSWKRTKAAINACDLQLGLLSERRQALITAAVTGQFDVSTASGRNVTEGVPA
ncbi:restriction endonuclease subunit S [Streptomyces sp. NPDC018955]|uniref:restriction endonuclease subunit S n=1 Tax=Streptomyces sp. NPDC018955 TaxID=3365055 RepID=UPI0037B17215